MKRILTIAGTVIGWLLASLPALQSLLYHALLLQGFRYTRFDTELLGMYVILLLIAFASPFYSETSEPAHYMQLDDVRDYGAGLLYAFFPTCQPEDAEEYYYRFVNCVDASYEIYAAWTLEPDMIAAEQQRVEALFAQQEAYWTVETARHGSFTCLMCYRQQHPLSLAGNNQYYQHALFAWNEATGEVRYMFNYGVDVPQELLPRCYSLEW